MFSLSSKIQSVSTSEIRNEIISQYCKHIFFIDHFLNLKVGYSFHYITNENFILQLLTLERAHMYSVDKQQVSIIQVRGNSSTYHIGENNGSTGSNLQRSPSVGSRPSSMSLSGDRPEKPPRPDAPETTKAHTRTRSEGNIIDVQTQTDTIIVSKSPQQPSPASPRFLQRPPRPQPPPPPPPTARTKSEQESTNL